MRPMIGSGCSTVLRGHTRHIRAHRGIDEVADLGEVNDFGELGIYLFLAESQDRSVQGKHPVNPPMHA